MSECSLADVIKKYTLEEQFSRVLVSSPYVIETLNKYTSEFAESLKNDFWFSEVNYTTKKLSYYSDIEQSKNDTDCKYRLRRFRNFHSARLLWLDLNNLIEWQVLLKAQSDLADLCVQAALQYLEKEFEHKYHTPLYQNGDPMQLCVVAMGKWGGQELNFSSDIDFIFLYGEKTEVQAKEGRRNLETHEYFIKVSQRLIRLLDDKTADGFVYRCDTRLRPFGDSGPLVVSVAALEQYLTQHGREWERYAYLKARCVSGDSGVCHEFSELRRPFVYRRYLDFGVFAKLRDMHAQIAEQVRKKEFTDNLKLGRGGIRECEFLIQAMQLLRGGRLKALQQTNFLSAYRALQEHGVWFDESDELLNSYVYLRLIENRLQALHQRQTHELPDNTDDQICLVNAMQANSWQSLLDDLASFRTKVVTLFDKHMSLLNLNIDTPESHISVDSLLNRFSKISPSCEQTFRDFFSSRYYRNLNDSTQDTLETVISLFLDDLETSNNATLDEINSAISNFINILRAIGKRSVYYSLLAERPAALKQLIKLCFVSEYLCEQISQRPILLDELLDARLFTVAPSEEDIITATENVYANSGASEIDQFVNDIVVHKHVQSFRIAVAEIFKNLPLMKVSDRLSLLAEQILNIVVQRVLHETLNKFSLTQVPLDQSGFAILAYGKLGGLELNYTSDLDIVFLYDDKELNLNLNESLSNEQLSKFYSRLVQQCLRYLNMPTSMGRIYEIDTRLRPSGNSGFLISSISAFENYQVKEAWVWEHQALTRARVILGSETLCETINQIRMKVLSNSINYDVLQSEILSMRKRMRKQFVSKSTQHDSFHLKHSPGGMIDIEFIVQYLVLLNAKKYPLLLTYSDNIRQLEALADCGILTNLEKTNFIQSYITLREHVHLLSLQAKEPLIAHSKIELTKNIVLQNWEQHFQSIE